MVDKNNKSRWDFIGREPEPEEERKTDKSLEISDTHNQQEENSKGNVLQIYYSLPEVLQRVTFAEEICIFLKKLAHKYDITNNQKKLAELAGAYLIDVLRPDEFKDRLKQELKLSRQTSEIIFGEINQTIFDSVRQSLHAIPHVELSQSSLEFETVKGNKVHSAYVTISNSGGGTLSGTIECDRPWLKTSQITIENCRNKQDIVVHADSSGHTPGFSETGRIIIKSNGGEKIITVRLSVRIEATARKRTIDIPEEDRLHLETRLAWAGGATGTILGIMVVSSLSHRKAHETAWVASTYMCVSLCAWIISEAWKDYKIKHELNLWECIVQICGMILLLPLALGIVWLISWIPFVGPLFLLVLLSVFHFALSAEQLLKAKYSGNKMMRSLLVLALSLPALFISTRIIWYSM